MTFKSIKQGHKGAVTVLHDTGKKHTLPQYLHGKVISDRRTARRPDIVLIFRIRGDRKLPEMFVPLDKSDDRFILILEVSYTALGLMSVREDDKKKKYEDTMEKLREDGWEPELFTLVLGTLGEIPFEAASVLESLGVRGKELDSLIDDIHLTAIHKADECIQKEMLCHEEPLEKNETRGGNGFTQAVRRKKGKRRK
eukprot:109916-Pyramimonas_sp.AAC.1